MTNTLSDALDYQVLASGFDHVEGVCWDAARACLWAGGEAGQVYRIQLDGTVEVVTTIDGGALLGLALDASGALYLCDPGNHQVWKMDTHFDVRAFGGPIDYPNYPAFAPDGRLFVSDSGDFATATGALVVIDPDGTTSRVATRPLAFANGIAIDDSTLWVIESAAPAVSAMSLDGGDLERVIELERCVPDGLAFDADGGLLISCYQPNQLWRWTGELRIGTDLRRVDRRADPLAHQRRLLRRATRPAGAGVAVRTRRGHDCPRAPGASHPTAKNGAP